MPNGRSGGFPITTVQLEGLVSRSANVDSIGTLVSWASPGKPRSESVSGAEVLRLMKDCAQERVAVEEQDQSSYIIHLSNDPVVWVLVGPGSPVFGDLRQQHVDWESEHPNWDGWLGF